MKLLFAYLSIVLFASCANSQDSEIQHEALIDQTKEDTTPKTKDKALMEYYQKAIKKDKESPKYEELFFESFPSTFSEFKKMYYVIDSSLYNVSYEHLKLFDSLSLKIEKKKYFEKLINLCWDGKWNAGSISQIQRILQFKVLEDPKSAFDVLKNKTEAEVYSFFFFFFDSIYPIWKKVPKQLTDMKEYDPKTYTIMERSLDDVLKKFKEHEKTKNYR
jgi:hypothetical protein